jgi:transcriptional regulator with XRE-family HTH domain/Zn-dependent peptidase ImmA (M78 family)
MLVQEIGNAVASARRRLGISLDELAEKTFLEVGLLELIERGERLVSTAKLDRIASALGIDAFALYAGKEVEHSLVVLPRHAARSDFQHRDLSELQRAYERAIGLFEISNIVGSKSLIEDFAARPCGSVPSEDGYHCARIVRKALGLMTERLDNLPILLAERFHVPVLTATLATHTLQAAMVRSAANRAAAIVLNRAVKDRPSSGTLQAWLVDRVSICHELCHVLFDEAKGGLIEVVLDDQESARAPIEYSNGRPAIEQRAGAFAAEILIPLLGLKKLLGEGTQMDTPDRAEEMIEVVRAHFKTPIEITVNHLYNHGYIARINEFREELITSLQAREIDELRLAPVDDSDAWKRVLRDRTREAHNKCLITDGMARALLEMEPGEPLPWEHELP